MATFGEITYMVLDILKERADDAYYTEEHILFLARMFRNFLIERKYKNTRNSTWQEMPDENKQEICLDLEADDLILGDCSGTWLKSVQKVPDTLGSSEPKIYTVSDMLHSMVTFIPSERMPYVGYNKWLKNIIYASKGADGHVYLNSQNPRFMYLKQVKMEAVFSNPEEAAKMACDADGEGGKCDILSQKFPLEEALIPSCIEMIVQELLGSRYAPEDKDNDAKDGLGEAAVTNQKAAKPAERATYVPKEEVE